MDASTTGESPSEAAQRFIVTVTVHGGDPGGLLRLVSVFHRRQVEILHATYSSAGSYRWMVATVETAEARLRTLALTLANTIGVTGYEVTACDEKLDQAAAPPQALRERTSAVPSR
jgi:hypothetical protein